MAAHRLPDVTVVADAGMISEANQKAIEAEGLSFILGMKVPDIAGRLFISRATVKTHLSHISPSSTSSTAPSSSPSPPGQPPTTPQPATEPRTPDRRSCSSRRRLPQAPGAAWATEQQTGRGSRGHRARRHMGGGYRTTGYARHR
jgi:hypothetical protein